MRVRAMTFVLAVGGLTALAPAPTPAVAQATTPSYGHVPGSTTRVYIPRNAVPGSTIPGTSYIAPGPGYRPPGATLPQGFGPPPSNRALDGPIVQDRGSVYYGQTPLGSRRVAPQTYAPSPRPVIRNSQPRKLSRKALRRLEANSRRNRWY